MPESALEKMLRANMADRRIIWSDFRYAGMRWRIVQIDQRNSEFAAILNQNR